MDNAKKVTRLRLALDAAQGVSEMEELLTYNTLTRISLAGPDMRSRELLDWLSETARERIEQIINNDLMAQKKDLQKILDRIELND